MTSDIVGWMGSISRPLLNVVHSCKYIRYCFWVPSLQDCRMSSWALPEMPLFWRLSLISDMPSVAVLPPMDVPFLNWRAGVQCWDNWEVALGTAPRVLLISETRTGLANEEPPRLLLLDPLPPFAELVELNGKEEKHSYIVFPSLM